MMNDTMGIILGFLIYFIPICASIFWLGRLIDLLCRDVSDFESHTHKLVWFIAIIVGNIVGAIWYSRWINRKLKKDYQETQLAINREMAECWKKSLPEEER